MKLVISICLFKPSSKYLAAPPWNIKILPSTAVSRGPANSGKELLRKAARDGNDFLCILRDKPEGYKQKW